MILSATLLFVSCSKNDDDESASDWVDLGLPSGLLWARCNLGATAPEGYGDYYAWGETETKEVYDWSTYKYCTVDEEGNLATLTKYNISSTYGNPDNLMALEAIDDVAVQKLGNGFRMPTADDWQELIGYTTVEWVTEKGVGGNKFTSKANGASIFLPAAGYRYGSSLRFAGSNGLYWASTHDADSTINGWGIRFYSDVLRKESCNRCGGQSVRPVHPTR